MLLPFSRPSIRRVTLRRALIRMVMGCAAGCCLVGVVGCTALKTARPSFLSLDKPQSAIVKLAVPKMNLPEMKLPEFKVPELKAPQFKLPTVNTPTFASKFSDDKSDKSPRQFRLASTGKQATPTQTGKKSTGQVLGDQRAMQFPKANLQLAKPIENRLDAAKPNGNQNGAGEKSPDWRNRDSHSDTMALIDDASEEVQDAFARAGSMPLGDSQMIDGTDVQSVLQPRDANSQPDQFRSISESEMLHLALSRSPILRSLGIRILDNPQAATTIYDVAINESDPFFGPNAALAEFDDVLSASLNSQNNDRVFNNATLGGQVQELTQDLVNVNAGWQRRTMSGATWEINSLTGYDNNNRSGNSFSNYWETQLEAGVRQPLLQGAGRQFNRIAGPNAQPGFNFSNGIVIAQMNNQISQADFEISLRSYVRDLYSAYWELVRQYTVYQNVLQSQELAYDTWQTVLAKGKADLEGGEANKEAQARAKYYSYRREVQIALGGDSGRSGMYGAERQLRQLIGLPAVDGQLLQPTDKPVSAKYVFNYDHLVTRAMSGRTELRRQNTKIRQQQLRLIAAKNFLLPQMDLIGRYRLRGFGDDLAGTGPRFNSAYDDFASLDHQEWEFGVEMGVTAGRRQAHAAVRNAKLQLSREQVIYCEQQRMVRHEMSEAFAEVSSAYHAMQSSTEQASASQERLKASEALFGADKIQIEFLLDAQEELLRAELQLASDQARYSLSLVEINNTSGTLLRDIGVNIAQSKCGTHVHYFQADSDVATTQQPVVPTPLNSSVPLDRPGAIQNDGELPEPLPAAPETDNRGDESNDAPIPELQPAPKKSLPESLINAPAPSLKQFFNKPVSTSLSKVPSRSVSFFKSAASKVTEKPASQIQLSEPPSIANDGSATTKPRVLAKPKLPTSESWTKKPPTTSSQSRFKLPRLFRTAPKS
ncbi:TolC family protein [Stieleria marina]|uniref:Outer membrane efflux protein n=1 Tax=Stieleria marina TaxID=1930275 RepID=A0A517P1M5_9BACT|nr:Outer membrane efflux protein [Planctomycetes bacterium K23_9]